MNFRLGALFTPGDAEETEAGKAVCLPREKISVRSCSTVKNHPELPERTLIARRIISENLFRHNNGLYPECAGDLSRLQRWGGFQGGGVGKEKRLEKWEFFTPLFDVGKLVELLALKSCNGAFKRYQIKLSPLNTN